MSLIQQSADLNNCRNQKGSEVDFDQSRLVQHVYETRSNQKKKNQGKLIHWILQGMTTAPTILVSIHEFPIYTQLRLILIP